jgi:hypothetical protein
MGRRSSPDFVASISKACCWMLDRCFLTSSHPVAGQQGQVGTQLMVWNFYASIAPRIFLSLLQEISVWDASSLGSLIKAPCHLSPPFGTLKACMLLKVERAFRKCTSLQCVCPTSNQGCQYCCACYSTMPSALTEDMGLPATRFPSVLSQQSWNVAMKLNLSSSVVNGPSQAS